MEKFKLPDSLKIGGHNYKVLFPYVFTERHDSYAQHDYSAAEFKIASVDDGQEIVDSAITVSFIHEVLHAIDRITGHKIFIDDEKAIEGFSECIYQILVDNGWLNETRR